jgi:hypothetical protein
VGAIDLSLADDEYGKKDDSGYGSRPGAGVRSPDMRKKGSGTHMGSPVENADLLYEYFPLSLDDWYVCLFSFRRGFAWRIML